MPANWHEEIFYCCREVYQVCGESSELRAREYRAEFERAVCQVLAREKDPRLFEAFRLFCFEGRSARSAVKAAGISRFTGVAGLSRKNILVGIVLNSKRLYPPSGFFS